MLSGLLKGLTRGGAFEMGSQIYWPILSRQEIMYAAPTYPEMSMREMFLAQVFIPEQVAYSKPDLERHMRTGDLTGPMAESGFKGHPQCRSAAHAPLREELRWF